MLKLRHMSPPQETRAKGGICVLMELITGEGDCRKPKTLNSFSVEWLLVKRTWKEPSPHVSNYFGKHRAEYWVNVHTFACLKKDLINHLENKSPVVSSFLKSQPLSEIQSHLQLCVLPAVLGITKLNPIPGYNFIPTLGAKMKKCRVGESITSPLFENSWGCFLKSLLINI